MLRDEKGQIAIVDSILFMTIMLVASAVVISAGTGAPVDSTLYAGQQQYAREYATALLEVELTGLSYEYSGSKIWLNNSGTSIGQLLCDRAMMERHHPGLGDYSEYDARILEAGRLLIAPGRCFAISCDDGAVFLSENVEALEDISPDRCASQLFVGCGSASPVTITIFVWVV